MVEYIKKYRHNGTSNKKEQSDENKKLEKKIPHAEVSLGVAQCILCDTKNNEQTADKK